MGESSKAMQARTTPACATRCARTQHVVRHEPRAVLRAGGRDGRQADAAVVEGAAGHQRAPRAVPQPRQVRHHGLPCTSTVSPEKQACTDVT